MKFIPNSFQVPNFVVDELMCKLSPAAFKAYLLIIRKTIGWQKDSDHISLNQLSEIMGMSKRQAQRATKELSDLGLIERQVSSTNFTRFKVTTYTASGDDIDGAEGDDIDGAIQKTTITKDTKTKDIVEQARQCLKYLNEKADRKYDVNNEKNIGLVKSRLSDGLSLDELKTMIDKKTDEWSHDEKWSQYLRPSTLFSPKNCAGYCAAAKTSSKKVNYRNPTQSQNYAQGW